MHKPFTARNRHTVLIQIGRNRYRSVQVARSPRVPPSRPGKQTRAPIHAEPEPVFRQNLHRALESSHRQQMAQRTLGTHAAVDWRETAREQDAQSRAWSSALFIMLLSCAWLALRRWVRAGLCV